LGAIVHGNVDVVGVGIVAIFGSRVANEDIHKQEIWKVHQTTISDLRINNGYSVNYCKDDKKVRIANGDHKQTEYLVWQGTVSHLWLPQSNHRQHPMIVVPHSRWLVPLSKKQKQETK
jgi:hypothetical protein